MSPGRVQPGHTALSPVVAQGGEHSLGQDTTPHPEQPCRQPGPSAVGFTVYFHFKRGFIKRRRYISAMNVGINQG